MEKQMKIATRLLKRGDIMASDEIVCSNPIRLNVRGADCLHVELHHPVKDTKRVALWNYRGTVFVKASP
jgi:hypothetical protein